MDTYSLIIGSSVVIILSFFFGEISKRTSIPSVLMLIFLGIGLQYIFPFMMDMELGGTLKTLGTIGLIMIVLEAALELELKPEKYWPIAKSFGIALVGLLASTWIAAELLMYFIDGMSSTSAWLYATPLSILSSAIIIPSVTELRGDKKEFHIYESTFSDILGIMLFFFLAGQLGHDSDIAGGGDHQGGGFGTFLGLTGLTVFGSLLISYVVLVVFQGIKSHTKLFLLIAVLMMFYAIGKTYHLSSLIMILVFGLMIANMKLFFKGPMKRFLDLRKARDIYEGLHVITMETAFVIRTLFFVVFGLTIAITSLFSLEVALVSLAILLSIYLIRFVLLRLLVGKDIMPQLFVAPRGLITVLLFNDIPEVALVKGFDAGILLFVIFGTSLIMTGAMIFDKHRSGRAIKKARANPIGYTTYRVPQVGAVKEEV
ncbi:cation:proton antiporter domain-containing protein [Neolewinella antarctica]|uniref:Kef-type K+ transport system membrane component KefB n=1 Tax=Neolewinella antarctica TaxID=442734 RepID=A0ABX0XCR1_9BACT|nr:cation:proton antiporter [Neolewinella antarctica]NJC27069.1 Kef-type K+ transport system membrane component KefB [Neolewinella antarctica]